MADYSDAFTGGTVGAVITGSNWSTYREGATDQQFKYATGGESVEPGASGASIGSRWIGGSVGTSQRSKITLASDGVISGSTFYVSVSARCSGSTTTAHCYQFTWTPSTWYISRVVNGTGTDLGAGISGAPANIASGATMEIVVTDSGTVSTIEGFYNGSSVGSRTYDHGGGTLGSGTPGFEAYNSGATLGKVGAWEGGDYQTASASSTLAATGGTGTLSASSTVTASSTFAATGGAGTLSASSSVLASITSEPLKDNAGNVLASVALDHVAIYDDTSGALVARLTGLTTNGSGVFVASHASLVAGTTYRIDWQTSTGKRRMPRKAAA